MKSSRVAVTIVTYNSAKYVAECLEYVLAQDHAPLEVIVLDNDSHDETKAILRRFEDRVRVLYNATNTGFAAAQNQAMAAATGADWFLALNPDVRLRPDFLRQLVNAATPDPEIGSVCGKLISTTRPLLDSTGITFTPSFRHFDRGNGQEDRGQYDKTEFVFGGTGAACLYRRTTIEDVAIDGEFFDADFFAYREDADVAWRMQLMGWKCLYVPAAVGSHVRHVTPEKRRELSPTINMHSVKNRWLMRIKNTTAGLYRRYWLPVTVRDVVVIGGCVAREWSSLRAFGEVWRLRKKMWYKRQAIMKCKRVKDDYIAAWFAGER